MYGRNSSRRTEARELPCGNPCELRPMECGILEHTAKGLLLLYHGFSRPPFRQTYGKSSLQNSFFFEKFFLSEQRFVRNQ